MVRFCVKTRLVLGRKQKRPATASRRWSHRARFHPPHPRSPGTPHSPATDPLRPRPAMNAIYITKIKTIASGKPLQSGPDPYAEKRIRKKPTNKLKRAYPEIERRLPVWRTSTPKQKCVDRLLRHIHRGRNAMEEQLGKRRRHALLPCLASAGYSPPHNHAERASTTQDFSVFVHGASALITSASPSL